MLQLLSHPDSLEKIALSLAVIQGEKATVLGTTARHQIHIVSRGERSQDEVIGGKAVIEELGTLAERREGNTASEMMIENAVQVGGWRAVHQDQKIEMKREGGPNGIMTFQESLVGDGVIVESDGDGGSISWLDIYISSC